MARGYDGGLAVQHSADGKGVMPPEKDSQIGCGIGAAAACARSHVTGLISGRSARRTLPSDSQLPTAHTISAAPKNEAPNAHTPVHCHRLHAKPARKVPSAPPTKYVTMKRVLMRLRASGINLWTRV